MGVKKYCEPFQGSSFGCTCVTDEHATKVVRDWHPTCFAIQSNTVLFTFFIFVVLALPNVMKVWWPCFTYSLLMLTKDITLWVWVVHILWFEIDLRGRRIGFFIAVLHGLSFIGSFVVCGENGSPPLPLPASAISLQYVNRASYGQTRIALVPAPTNP